MKFYLLHKSNLEVQEIAFSEYIKQALHGNSEGDDDVLFFYNPESGRIVSLNDISKYWFHVFDDSVDESAHDDQEKAEEFVNYISDYGRDRSALYNYRHTINHSKYYRLETDHEENMYG